MSESVSNKRIAKNTLFLYIRMGLVFIVALYTTRVVLRNLGVEDYGIYGVVCGFVSMFGILNITFTSSINRFYNFAIGKGDSYGVKKVYNTAVYIQVLVALIVVLTVEIVGGWYISNKMVLPPERLSVAKYIFHFAMMSLVMAILQTPYNSIIMAKERMNYYAFVSIIDVGLKLIIVFLLPLVNFDKLLFYGILLLMVSATNFLLYFIYARLCFDEIRFDFIWDKALFKEMISFSGWSLLDPFAYTIRGQGCNMALNVFFGPVVNAAYSISNQVATNLDQFTQNIAVAFRPQVIQSYSSGNLQRTKRLMFSMSKINFMLLLMLAVPIGMEIQYILDLWLGEYPAYAVAFTGLVLIVKNIDTLNLPVTTVVMATGKMKLYMLVSSLFVSSTLLVTIILLYSGFPPTSMYYGMICITLINQTSCVFILTKVFPIVTIREYLTQIIKPCLIQVFAVVVSNYLFHICLAPSLWRLLIMGIVSVIVSVGVAYCVTLDEAEKVLATNFIVSIYNKVRKKPVE